MVYSLNKIILKLKEGQTMFGFNFSNMSASSQNVKEISLEGDFKREVSDREVSIKVAINNRNFTKLRQFYDMLKQEQAKEISSWNEIRLAMINTPIEEKMNDMLGETNHSINCRYWAERNSLLDDICHGVANTNYTAKEFENLRTYFPEIEYDRLVRYKIFGLGGYPSYIQVPLLHLALFGGNNELFNYLLEKGADIFQPTSQGKTIEQEIKTRLNTFLEQTKIENGRYISQIDIEKNVFLESCLNKVSLNIHLEQAVRRREIDTLKTIYLKHEKFNASLAKLNRIIKLIAIFAINENYTVMEFQHLQAAFPQIKGGNSYLVQIGRDSLTGLCANPGLFKYAIGKEEIEISLLQLAAATNPSLCQYLLVSDAQSLTDKSFAELNQELQEIYTKIKPDPIDEGKNKPFLFNYIFKMVANFVENMPVNSQILKNIKS